jgi:lipopolysaccharide transport system ATP-binding protein
MNGKAIEIKNIGKKYQIRDLQSQKETLVQFLARAILLPIRRAIGLIKGNYSSAADMNSTFWALRNINLDILQGETVGIIGENGSGKSTLLKILSRITAPTEGSAWIHGQVGSLLEVGTGFNVELTGRENIYLNGTILGMSIDEINSKFDEIVEFSGMSDFLDTPVKHYSSGMSVRLAFSVAAHLNTDILLIDEVLSVGDYAFQKKSLARMKELVKDGRTVLFVSHQLELVQEFCQKTILMRKGQIEKSGSTREVIQYYTNGLMSIGNKLKTSFQCDFQEQKPYQILAGKILSDVPQEEGKFKMFDTIIVELDYHIGKPRMGLKLAILLYRSGVPLCLSWDSDTQPKLLDHREPGYYRTRIVLPSEYLKSGFYYLDVSLSGTRRNAMERDKLDGVLAFEIVSDVNPVRLYSYESNDATDIALVVKWTTELLTVSKTNNHANL